MELVALLIKLNAKLHRVVEKAIIHTTNSKYLLLTKFKSTLDILQLDQWIEQRDYKLLQNPQLVEKLITKIHKTIELVGKFTKPSKFHVFKYCFGNKDDAYADQIVEMDSYFGKMVEFLWRLEKAEKTTKLFRKLRRVSAEAAERKLPMELVERLENSMPSSSSNVESSQVGKLRSSFQSLLCLVKARDYNCGNARLKTLVGDLRSTLEKLKPFVDDIDMLNISKKELEAFRRLVDERITVQVVVPDRKSNGGYDDDVGHMIELLGLNHSFQGELRALREKLESVLNNKFDFVNMLMKLGDAYEETCMPREVDRDRTS